MATGRSSHKFLGVHHHKVFFSVIRLQKIFLVNDGWGMGEGGVKLDEIRVSPIAYILLRGLSYQIFHRV